MLEEQMSVADPSVPDSHGLRVVLQKTRDGTLGWEQSGSPDAYRGKWPEVGDVFVLDRGSRHSGIRLRIMSSGQPDAVRLIEQTLSDPRPDPQQEDVDALLALLFQLVRTALGGPGAADLFFSTA